MKTVLVGLAALLIAVECFAGPRFMRLTTNIHKAAEHNLYKPQTLEMRNALANRNAATLGEPGRNAEREGSGVVARSLPQVAAEKEAAHLIVDWAGAREALEQIRKGDPDLAYGISKDLVAGRRYFAAQKLGGFTTADIKHNLKEEAATARPQQAAQELQGVANISNELVNKAVSELPDQFFDNPTKPPFDSGMQKVVEEHKPIMGERITYDSSSSQLEFEFDSPQVSLNQASADIGQRFDLYRKKIIQKKPDFALRLLAPW